MRNGWIRRMISIIIADDSDFVRDGLRIILDMDPDFTVLGCAKNGEEAVELARAHHPDIILMDIQMPIMDGTVATKIITEEELGKVLILTTFDDFELVEKAIRNGAKGYLIKNHTPDKLKQMIKSIEQGMNVLDEQIYQMVAYRGPRKSNQFQSELFSQRELEIIEAIAEGMSNREIG